MRVDLAADREARALAQREMRRPLVVEAGAGTGKTATLVARILAWCLDRGWTAASDQVLRRWPGPGTAPRSLDERTAATTVAGVLAVTFTEAAAAEMAERVAQGFATLRDGDVPIGFDIDAVDLGKAERRRRAGLLLAAADGLQVRTLHSLCRRLLAQHPLEAGLHPRFTVDADGTVLSEAVDEVLGEHLESPAPAFLELASRGHGPDHIARTLRALAAAGLSGDELAVDPFDDGAMRALAGRLNAAAMDLLALLEGRRVGDTRARNAIAISTGLADLRRRLRRAPSPAVRELQGWLEEALPAELTRHLKRWASGRLDSRSERTRLATVRPRLRRLAGELADLRGHVAALDPALDAAARRLLAPLLGAVHDRLRRRGAVGFDELLRRARDLLHQHPMIRRQARRRIDQLLVDEFQDSDRTQCDVVRFLALDGPVEERPGLFVVGDPKQSIYGWRSADLAAYEALVGEIEAAGGRRVALDQNFRSVPPILAEVEAIVGPVMQRRPGLQPDFRALSPCRRLRADRGYVDGERASVEHWISWIPDQDEPTRPAVGTAAATAELEARAVAADLLALGRAAVAWRDIALLLRSLTDVEVYLAALREARIPFTVSRDGRYYRRREVIDAAALVRAVLAPEDHLALVTWLRSPAVGVPDAALLRLWAGGLPGLLTDLDRPDAARLATVRTVAEAAAADPPAGVPGWSRVGDWHVSLIAAVEALGRLREAFAEEPSDVFVDLLERLTLHRATEGARYLGAYRVANLERFRAELLEDLETSDREGVLRRLRRRVAEGTDAEEAQPDPAEDAVRVMTLHRAKGLEFDHVYLVQQHKESGERGTPSVDLGQVVGSDGAERWELRLFGAPTPGLDRLVAHREAVAGAELVRTLYVGATRAARRLVVVGRRPMVPEPVDLEAATTHADLLTHRAGEETTYEELLTQWAEGRERRLREGVAWVLPGVVGEIELDRLAAPARRPPPSAARVAADARELAAARAAAAARQERAFVHAASKYRGWATQDGLGLDPLAPIAAPPGGSARLAALLAGAAIHRVLEGFDLAADLADEVARQRRRLADQLPTSGDPAVDEAASARAGELFERLAGGALLRRLVALHERILARELPVLLPPDAAPTGVAPPVGYVAGVIDLVYRDRETGELVVVDFKTGEAAEHTSQGAIYTRALGEALDLDHPPRLELWWIAEDRVEVVG